MESTLYSKIYILSSQTINTIFQSIANYILENLQNIKYLGIEKLAEKSYTSKTTVLRFCKYLGLSGYKEFINQLKEVNNPKTPKLLLEKENDNIEKIQNFMVKNFDEIYWKNIEALLQIKRFFSKTKDVYLFGFGNEAIPLEYFGLNFYEYNFNIHYNPSIEVQAEYLKKISSANGLFIFVSFDQLPTKLTTILNTYNRNIDSKIICVSNSDEGFIWNISDVRIDISNKEDTTFLTRFYSVNTMYLFEVLKNL